MFLQSLKEEIKNIPTNKKEIRKFAWTLSIVFFLLSMVFLFQNKNDYFLYFFILSLLILSGGLFAFQLLKPIQKAWMTLAIVLGAIMNRVILIFLFYSIFTLIGLILRIFKKDLLNLKMKKNQTSYWQSREKVKSTKEDYERQF